MADQPPTTPGTPPTTPGTPPPPPPPPSDDDAGATGSEEPEPIEVEAAEMREPSEAEPTEPKATEPEASEPEPAAEPAPPLASPAPPAPPLAPPGPPAPPAPPLAPPGAPLASPAPPPPLAPPGAPLASPAPPPTPAPPPPGPAAARPGYYPQQAYYAGWTPTAPPRRRGRRVAVWTLAVAVVLAVLAGAGTTLFNWLKTRPVGDVNGPTNVTSRQVRTGHCIAELPADGVLDGITLVPCDDPHEAEVVGELQLEGDAWPGDGVATDRASTWCEMDSEQVEAGFRPVVWTPSKRSWSQGDRLALCLAALDDGRATGSFGEHDEVTTTG